MQQIVINIIIFSFVYFLIAISFLLIHKILRFMHFAHAISITLGAYIVYTVTIIWGGKIWIAIVGSTTVCAFLMFSLNCGIYKALQKRKSSSWQMTIASIGFYVVLQNFVSMIWGNSTLSFRTWEVKVGREFFGAYISDMQITTIVGCILLVGIVQLFMKKTIIGKIITAVSSNSELSSVLGMSKDKAVIWSLVIGTLLATCAGILIAADFDMTPSMGFNWLMYGVVAMIIGGMGKMRHIILGALLLATAQHLSAYFIGSKWMNATAYIILVIFLYFRPFGFSGKKLKKMEV